ncbi:hypothetical protein J0895_09320 [Phormidium pseudopriestleyi FRX01]|uniref:Uncharacterized protein n=1 Tax=Phormidium pseudopriestleyi FRX01 TaxID=1759528 RepID=A0ABS3FSE9_9CYAN|nr:hypothetical protein [Phormidium pseudopriestleyi]MBO0349302.1 hypothetical protein [Phormidium pseudopriestleyi FRX01]
MDLTFSFSVRKESTHGNPSFQGSKDLLGQSIANYAKMLRIGIVAVSNRVPAPD